MLIAAAAEVTVSDGLSSNFENLFILDSCCYSGSSSRVYTYFVLIYY